MSMLRKWVRRVVALQLASATVAYGVAFWLLQIDKVGGTNLVEQGIALIVASITPLVVALCGAWLSETMTNHNPLHSMCDEGAVMFFVGVGTAVIALMLFFVRIAYAIGMNVPFVLLLCTGAAAAGYAGYLSFRDARKVSH